MPGFCVAKKTKVRVCLRQGHVSVQKKL